MMVSNVSGQTAVKSIGDPVYNTGGAVMNNFMKGLLTSTQKKEGGKVNNNDKEMVDGIADLLTKVKDPKNRKDIFLQMIQDFDKEGVKYNKKDFKKKANVLQNGGTNKSLFDRFADYTIDNILSDRGDKELAYIKSQQEKEAAKRKVLLRKQFMKNKSKYSGETNNSSNKLAEVNKLLQTSPYKEKFTLTAEGVTDKNNNILLSTGELELFDVKDLLDSLEKGGKLKLKFKSGGPLKHNNKAPDSSEAV